MYLVQSGNRIGAESVNAIAECLTIVTCLQELSLVRFVSGLVLLYLLNINL
jgi:hypothetical protein